MSTPFLTFINCNLEVIKVTYTSTVLGIEKASHLCSGQDHQGGIAPWMGHRSIVGHRAGTFSERKPVNPENFKDNL